MESSREIRKRPYVICHILSSLDGKINGPFMATETTRALGGEYGRFCNKGRAEAHVIEILTKSTSASYKAYLRKHGVSYLIAGENKLDCKVAMEKLYKLFHIEKVLICGGGLVNWSFLQAGMVDELSLFLAPVTDGSSGTASLFAHGAISEKGRPVEFCLKEARPFDDGGVHLRYLPRNVDKD